jgi:lysophospholipase L1-like esterase
MSLVAFTTRNILTIVSPNRPGFRVDQISDRANNDLPLLPNLVLINAGTNDVAQGYELDTIDQRLEDLVNKLLDGIPGTTVIVSTLLVNRNTTKQASNQIVNLKYVSTVESMAAAGKRVYLADMSSITTDMINARDGTHPTDCKPIKNPRKCTSILKETF